MRFKMAAIRHVDFSETLFMTHALPLAFHHYTKYGEKSLIDSQVMPQKNKFKMAAAVMLNRILMAILNILPSLNYRFQPCVKIPFEYLSPWLNDS